MTINRSLVVVAVLAVTAAVSFGLPKPRYESVDILKSLSIPVEAGDWKGEDVTAPVSLDEARYNFIQRMFARVYTRTDGAMAQLVLLDAGNFHNPRVCYSGAGFTPEDHGSRTFEIAGRAVSANAVLMRHPESSFVSVYWLCIDKKVVSWAEQKVQRFVDTLTNRKRAGLMVRLDIPIADPLQADAAYGLVQNFFADLALNLSSDDSDYLLGQKL